MTNRLTRAELLRRAALGGAAAAAPSLLAGAAQGATKKPVRAQTNGNKPQPTVYRSAFTRRVATLPRVAYYPLWTGPCQTAVAMVIDEILVGKRAAGDPGVQNLLSRQAINTHRTVFGGLKSPPREDVQIWRLKKTPGTQNGPDVANFVWTARKLLNKKGIPPEQVAPNHVLIPSFNYHTCPGGPPEDTNSTGVLKPSGEHPVVVIDSGYVSDGPVASLVDPLLEHGQWFSAKPKPGYPGSFAPPFLWIDEPDEPAGPSYVTVPGNRLATLVAHANFVAGVIAQVCEAQITLVNHNGALIEKVKADTPIPTEASVARSLWIHRAASVINVGYAFATLPNAPVLANTADKSGPPSWVFQVVLNQIDTKKTVLVAPAGNQNCPTRQYPAAFHLSHPNVIGVGSISPSGGRSKFSNYGPWVACCTEGERVLSSFITDWVAKPTEDAESNGTRRKKTFTSGWALWSGTSFAAPKVAAAIACNLGPGQSPLGAWLALAAPAQSGLQMGKILSGLPPTA